MRRRREHEKTGRRGDATRAPDIQRSARLPVIPSSRLLSGDPLPIRSLDFLGGMAEPGGWRPDAELPEIAFCGRSNVGKSSLLNTLVRRKSLARVSNTPGRTREINFFRVNAQFLLVDLPGYGYARVSKDAKAKWKPLVESYLTTSPQLRGVVQLLDVRHDPTADDVGVIEWLRELGVPVMIVATKTDKLSASAVSSRIAHVASLLFVGADAILTTSASTGAGRDELARAVMELVSSTATTL